MKAPPSDPHARLVYADYLQSIGDPRGELIALQHARNETSGTAQLEAAARAEVVHLLRHRDALCGEIDEARVSLAWELGYIREAYFARGAGPDELRKLLEIESSRFLNCLGINCVDRDEWTEIESLLVGADQKLEALYLVGNPPVTLADRLAPTRCRLWIHGHCTPQLSSAAAHLQYLRLQLRTDEPIALPKTWPALEFLHRGQRELPDDALRDSYRAFFEAAKLPVLEHLSLQRTAGFTAELAAAVADHPRFPKLSYLSLSHGDLTTADAKQLATAIAERDSRLEILDIDENNLETISRELNETGVDIHYGVQNTTTGRKSNIWGRNVSNRDRYERPDGDHCNTSGVEGLIRKQARECGLEAAVKLYDSIPLMSPYRQGSTGAQLAQKVLKYLAKGDQYESILRICRETPHSARTEIILRYEALAHLVADRFAEARAALEVEKADEEVLVIFRRWAKARLGDDDSATALIRSARRDSRWAKYAAAAVQRGPAAATLLKQALDDVMPTIPSLPCHAASQRVFAASPMCLEVLKRMASS